MGCFLARFGAARRTSSAPRPAGLQSHGSSPKRTRPVGFAPGGSGPSGAMPKARPMSFPVCVGPREQPSRRGHAQGRRDLDTNGHHVALAAPWCAGCREVELSPIGRPDRGVAASGPHRRLLPALRELLDEELGAPGLGREVGEPLAVRRDGGAPDQAGCRDEGLDRFGSRCGLEVEQQEVAAGLRKVAREQEEAAVGRDRPGTEVRSRQAQQHLVGDAPVHDVADDLALDRPVARVEERAFRPVSRLACAGTSTAPRSTRLVVARRRRSSASILAWPARRPARASRSPSGDSASARVEKRQRAELFDLPVARHGDEVRLAPGSVVARRVDQSSAAGDRELRIGGAVLDLIDHGLERKRSRPARSPFSRSASKGASWSAPSRTKSRCPEARKRPWLAFSRIRVRSPPSAEIASIAWPSAR